MLGSPEVVIPAPHPVWDNALPQTAQLVSRQREKSCFYLTLFKKLLSTYRSTQMGNNSVMMVSDGSVDPAHQQPPPPPLSASSQLPSGVLVRVWDNVHPSGVPGLPLVRKVLFVRKSYIKSVSRSYRQTIEGNTSGVMGGDGSKGRADLWITVTLIIRITIYVYIYIYYIYIYLCICVHVYLFTYLCNLVRGPRSSWS